MNPEDLYRTFALAFYLNSMKKSKKKARRAYDQIRYLAREKALTPETKREIREACKRDAHSLQETNYLLHPEEA